VRHAKSAHTALYNPAMNPIPAGTRWRLPAPVMLAPAERLAHVRRCSPYAADLLDRHPDWAEGLEQPHSPDLAELQGLVLESGFDAALRLYRNRCMLGIIWRDLCGLSTLDQTFTDLGKLATNCVQAALDHHYQQLSAKHGQPCNAAGKLQYLVVIALGKFGGCELNLSSDIDILFCYDSAGECINPDVGPDAGPNATSGSSDGLRLLSADQFFTRQARAVIASLSEIQDEGFCFRVDTRLRPFGDSGPLCSSLAAMEQYYQREGRDWERYAWVKAWPVAGDLQLGQRVMQVVRPFVYRRYIDFSAVEALQEMHLSVLDDARQRDRLDDIKRGPGGIREIEFLVQCFQLLRGGRETSLQTPSLLVALHAVEELQLMAAEAIQQVHEDYGFLRCLENRIQALHDQQTHELPEGEDLERLAQAMRCGDVAELEARLERVRHSVSQRFEVIFPSRSEPQADPQWARLWRQAQDQTPAAQANGSPVATQTTPPTPLEHFLATLQRLALSQRARRRLDLFMPVLLGRLQQRELGRTTQNRIFDLVLAICRRSAYLVLLVQHPAALDRLIELFSRSEAITERVIRFPALLDELIDPALGHQIPEASDLLHSVRRLLVGAPETEAALEGLNYLKLANTLRIAVAQLEGNIDGPRVQRALTVLASALLQGTLELAERELVARHGRIESRTATVQQSAGNSLAVIAYGSLGSGEAGYESDLDLVFLFDASDPHSDGERSLGPDRYYARLAQRMLGLLTAMTPSGRLYEVDTRLRPNGRAGSLVSSLAAFHDYQLQQAWTWELQALTRACPIAGDEQTGEVFQRIRREVLGRDRSADTVRAELRDMRQRIAQEKGRGNDVATLAKHGPGGLIDIGFTAQLGVLCEAARHPTVMQSSSTAVQLRALCEAGWLPVPQAQVLLETASVLHELRLLTALVSEPQPAPDTGPSARICAELLHLSPPDTVK
jgi:glutamate-ammonia-ligase adenylyltransferase